jgi:GntR family transcriptional repressor for pyruvate dehydrogenase complex
MPKSNAATDPFSQVAREPPLSDKVAKLITEAILAGHFAPGERLDSERELAEKFGVSRTVIREAIRSVAAQGLVEARSGRGVQVAEVDGESLSRAMSLYLRSNPKIDYPLVHEVRSALEAQIAAIAASRATLDDLSLLEETNQKLATTSPKEAATLDVEFHRLIAAATHNQLFVVLLDSIGDILLDVRRAAFAVPGMLKYAAGAHTEILARLNARDPEGAREAMRAHLDRAEEVWSSLPG